MFTCPTTFTKTKLFLNLSLFSHLPKFFPFAKAQLKGYLLHGVFSIEDIASPKAKLTHLSSTHSYRTFLLAEGRCSPSKV